MSKTDQSQSSSAVDQGSRWLRRIFTLLALATIVIVAVAAVVTWPHTRAFYTDADKIDRPEDAAGLRDILWQPPETLTGMVDASIDEYEPALSADGMTLYFVRGKAGKNADLYYRGRTPNGWSAAAPLASLNTSFDELGPEPSADGMSLYFYSDRTGGLGGYDLWVAHRDDTSQSVFGDPVNLGTSVNSEFNDYGPALTAKGDRLYFSSNRPQASDEKKPDPKNWPGTIREEVFQRTYDLYWAPITERGLGQSQPLRALNTPFNEGAPAVTPFGDFLYFASDRKGSKGGFDIYRSRLVKDAFRLAENLGDPVNSAGNELDPGLSMGGYALYFSSDRAAHEVVSGAPVPYQLYRTTSREVYRRTETTRAEIDWAAIWSAVGPNLMWALLALLLLLLLLAGMRDAQRRKLSLLARCLLASLFVHMLLMLLFNVWGVTSKLAYALGKKGPIQVALVASAQGGDITSQIRGGFTDVKTPTPDTPDIQREPAKLDWTPSATPVALQAAATAVQVPRTVSDTVPSRDATPRATTQQVEATIPQQSSIDAPSMQMNLPQEAERISAQEATVPSMQPPTSRPQDRPATTTELFSNSTPTQLVDVAPTPSQSTATPDAVSSLSSGPAPRESAPTTPSFAMTSVDVSSAPSTLQVTLPLPSEVASQTGPETPLELPAPAQGSADADRPVHDKQVFAEAETASSVAFLAPTPVDAPAAEPSFTGTATLEATDATLQPARTQTDTIVDGAVPGAAAMELALPQMEESSSTPAGPEELALVPAPTRSRDAERGGGWFADPGTPKVSDLGVVADAGTATADAPQLLALGEQDTRDASVRSSTVSLIDSDAVASAIPSETFVDFQLPTEVDLPDDPFLPRRAEDRMSIVEAMGGNRQTEDAVQRALQWLANHQSDDGRWDSDGFDDSCGECGGETDAEVDVALTGMALLCFLAADHTHEKDGPYRDHVDRAIKWLLSQQDDDGDLRSGETMYSHGIASIALSEAFGMTHDSRLRDPVRRATHFITGARSRETGIWRYEPGESGDTSVLGWQIMALKSAAAAGIDVPMEPFVAASRWLDRVSPRDYPGLYAYRPRQQVTHSMTAEGLFIQQILGRRRDEPRMQQSVAFLMTNLPDWERDSNTYYWYYATLALFQHQGEPWRIWNRKLMPELLDNQHKNGGRAGSWDPVGEWGEVGGRVYQTALCTLMLEVYYRYLPMLLEERPADAIGTIRGRVTDVSSDEPIPSARVRLVLPDREPVVVEASADGTYVLHPPEVPSFFALSASADGFAPQSRNVAKALVRGSELTLNFELEPTSMTTVAIEASPDVHHLGDDAFSGSVNSQFQKRSEGSRFKATFNLSSSQLPPHYDEAELTFLVKGVQMAHRIRINGRTLRQRLDDSPNDGSFGQFSASIDPELFEEGENTIEILAKSRGSDVDDFEFVNIQIHLAR